MLLPQPTRPRNAEDPLPTLLVDDERINHLHALESSPTHDPASPLLVEISQKTSPPAEQPPPHQGSFRPRAMQRDRSPLLRTLSSRLRKRLTTRPRREGSQGAQRARMPRSGHFLQSHDTTTPSGNSDRRQRHRPKNCRSEARIEAHRPGASCSSRDRRHRLLARRLDHPAGQHGTGRRPSLRSGSSDKYHPKQNRWSGSWHLRHRLVVDPVDFRLPPMVPREPQEGSVRGDKGDSQGFGKPTVDDVVVMRVVTTSGSIP